MSLEQANNSNAAAALGQYRRLKGLRKCPLSPPAVQSIKLENWASLGEEAADRYGRQRCKQLNIPWSAVQKVLGAILSPALCDGYGHVTPLSKTGKGFCMLYAMLGIPLTLVLMSALAERLRWPATRLLQALNARLGHLYQPFNIRLLHLAIVATLVVVVFMLIPASVFAALEPEWDYLDSLYYCFISLTTVGLGDYIPGDSPNQAYRPLYKVATTGYLLAGLTFMMLTLTVFNDIPQLNLGMLFLMRSDETTGDPEKVRLQTPGSIGPKYTQQVDAVVRVKSRRDDSPSPEDTTPVHAHP